MNVHRAQSPALLLIALAMGDSACTSSVSPSDGAPREGRPGEGLAGDRATDRAGLALDRTLSGDELDRRRSGDGPRHADAGGTDQATGLCRPGYGLRLPSPGCSAVDPCTHLLGIYQRKGISQLSTPIDPPDCRTDPSRAERYQASDGAPHSWTDAAGVKRYHCEFRPAGTSTTSKRPLVVFITGSGGSASDLYNFTSLRQRAASFLLSGDAARPGFILVMPQARNLHWPTPDPQDGSKFETYYRDLASPSTNPDMIYLDHLLDSFSGADDVVDASRLYLMGWSNGGRFSSTYGIARHQLSTPGGRRVAAVANYSSGDPWLTFDQTQAPDCTMSPYPLSTLPLAMISRTCDAVACNAAQAQSLQQAGLPIAPGNVADAWINVLKSSIGATDVKWLRIDGQGQPALACALLCGSALALLNHLHWPDGIADQGGVDHEPYLLDYLRDHPL